MRYKFTFKLADPGRNVLPVNYQFELGAWLYQVVNNTGTELSEYLRNAGCVREEGHFRTFVFSHLAVPDRRIEADRLIILGERISMIFSTIPDGMLAAPVVSTFTGRNLVLGDKISQASLTVEKVTPLPEPVFSDKMTFRALSPLHLEQKVAGRKQPIHLSPEDPGFREGFFRDLHAKFNMLNGYDHPHDPLVGKFKLRSEVTRKGIVMQAGTPGQNKLIGYQLRFRLHADPLLLKAGYYLGFGEKNHLGFGCCEIL